MCHTKATPRYVSQNDPRLDENDLTYSHFPLNLPPVSVRGTPQPSPFPTASNINGQISSEQYHEFMNHLQAKMQSPGLGGNSTLKPPHPRFTI